MRMNVTIVLALAVVQSMPAVAGDGGAAVPPGPPPATAPAPAEPPPLGAETRKALDAVLADYEAMRVLLAGDKLEGIAKAAKQLNTTAMGAAKKAPAFKAQLDPVASAAQQMEKQHAVATPDDLRRLFGDLSRGVIGLVVAAPALAAGRVVFECPMAQGYKKWVQPSEKIANPYMGARMPACGSVSKWSP